MNRIFKVKEAFKTNFGSSYEVGDKFFEIPPTFGLSTPSYEPFKGGYPISNIGFDIDSLLEFDSETDKEREYFLTKKYSQSEVDEMISNLKK